MQISTQHIYLILKVFTTGFSNSKTTSRQSMLYTFSSPFFSTFIN